MEQSRRNRGWLIQLGTALVLVATFGCFIWIWVPARQHAMREQNFRILGGVSDQIVEALNTLKGSLQNAAVAAATDSSVTFERRLALIRPTVEVVTEFTTNTVSHEVPVKLSERRGIGNTWLHIEESNSSETGKVNRIAKTYSFEVRVSLNELVEPIVSFHDFDDILLVKSDGEVIFELSEVRSRMTNLLAGSELRISRLAELDGGDGKSNSLLNTTSLTNVFISGAEYHLSIQPMRFSFASNLTNVTEWYLCGLTSVNRLRAESLNLPPAVVILFAFAAAVVLISWPFLNIFFCGPREEVGRGEALGIAFSSYIASATVTFLVLVLLVYPRAKRELDRDLSRLATSIYHNVANELIQADQTLRALGARLTKMADHITGDENVDSDTAYELSRKPTILKDNAVFASNSPAVYPFLKMAAWADASGTQVVKWATASTVTPSVPVADRYYFRIHPEGRSWPQDIGTNVLSALPNKFCLEPIFSRTRGENVAVYSIPFTNKWPASQYLLKKPVVAYLEFRPLSLFHPVLPPGYQFCVVDAQGRVLFHSDERRNLRENLIKEVDNPSRLLAALRARVTDDFDADYFNLPQRVHVTPMEGFPWSLVTFRDRDHLSGGHATMLSAAAILFGIYTAGVVLLAVAWRLYAKLGLALMARRPLPWLLRLWPDAALHDVYLRIFAVNVLLCTFLVLGMVGNRSSNWVIAATAILPILALLFAGRQLNRSGRVEVPRRGFTRLKDHIPWRTAYILALASLLLIAAVLPALTSYQLAWRQEKEVFVKSLQLGLGQEIRARNARLRSDPTLGPLVSSSLLTNRLANTTDFYFTNILQTEIESTPRGATNVEDTLDLARSLYHLFRPAFGVLRVETGNLLGRKADDKSWRSFATITDVVTELQGEDKFGQRGALRLHSTALSASPGTSSLLWLLWCLGVSIILGIILFLAWFLARYLLLIDLPPDGGPVFLPKTFQSAQHFHFSQPTTVESPLPPALEPFVAFEKTCILVVDLNKPEDCQTWLQFDDSSKLRRTIRQLKRDAVVAIAHLDKDLGPDAVANKPDPNTNKRLFLFALDQDPAKTIVLLGAINLSKLGAQYSPGPARDWWSSWFKFLCPAWRDPAAPECRDSSFPNPESIARELARDYERRWQKCSAGEKVTLHEVASNGFSSRRRPELRSLLANGLLRLDPQLRLCNESFRRFVLARFNAVEIRTELPPVEDSLFRWNSLKTTLGIALTLVAVFLFITQQDTWTLVVGLASTFATGFGQLSKIPGLIPKGGKKKTESGGDE